MQYPSPSRRKFTVHLLGLAAAVASPVLRSQTKWPSRPVNCVVAFAPGGGTDFVMRAIGPALATRWGESFVVDNRPGASGIIAAQYVARAPADGYTLFGTDGGALVVNGVVFPNLPYDPRRDFAPVAMVIRAPVLILAHPSFPADDLRGLVAIAQRDKTLNYASVGQGTYQSLAMELLKRNAKFEAQAVPYKGAAPAAQAVISGQVPVMAQGAVAGIPQVRSGQVKCLGVLTRERIAALPHAQSIVEQGFEDIDLQPWVGVLAPRRTPPDVVARLNRDIDAVVATKEIADRFTNLGMQPMSMPPEQFGRYIDSEIQRLHPLVRSLNIKPD